MDPFVLLILVILLALAFDYVNGFMDTANAIATVVSTNVLSPRAAIALAASMNLAGALIGLEVAKTIGSSIADPTSITQVVIGSGLIGAITWNLITWYFGIPSSASHSLVGGLVGAILAHRVLDQDMGAWPVMVELFNSKGVTKVVLALIFSPLFGLALGFMLMIGLTWMVRRWRPNTVSSVFKKLQLVSAAAMAIAHGNNDAQKAMGIITMALIGYYAGQPASEVPGWLDVNDFSVPLWVVLACAGAMALGTAAGGWRIIKTLGHKIIKLRPIHGFAAETAAAGTILVSSFLGAPVSTTHVISSTIMGVGACKRFSAVRWGVAGNMVVAWILTIPLAALFAMIAYLALRYLG